MKLNPEAIDQIFAAHEHQWDVFFALHRLLYDGSAKDRPAWDSIEKLCGWPRMGPEVSKYIRKLFLEFDQKHHPKVITGGLWMNSGWSTDKELDGWQVEPAPATLKEEPNESTKLVD